jgi:hypothetical protein
MDVYLRAALSPARAVLEGLHGTDALEVGVVVVARPPLQEEIHDPILPSRQAVKDKAV